MARQDIQDKMLTTGMGGVLPELAGRVDYSCLQRVLDVGCGTGGWLMETARTYPTIETSLDNTVHLVSATQDFLVELPNARLGNGI
jgi:trans-aconitate methyltransferase